MAEREEDTIDRAIGSALAPDGSVWQLLDHDSVRGEDHSHRGYIGFAKLAVEPGLSPVQGTFHQQA